MDYYRNISGVLLIGSALAITVFSAPAFAVDATQTERPPSTLAVDHGAFTYPMHPEVRMGMPGACPKCGMDLQSVEAKDTVKPLYTCPMDPDVTSDKPGRCAKCGMALERGSPKAVPTPAAKDDYACPMHPQNHSNKPGRCPDCGMHLERF